MSLTVSNQDLVVLNGGGATATTGHQSHYPIWVDEDGVEYISLDGYRFTVLSTLNPNVVRRENVIRK